MDFINTFLGDKPMNVIVPTVLFILLSPDLLLTIPANSPKINVVLTHALVFFVVYALLRKQFAYVY